MFEMKIHLHLDGPFAQAILEAIGGVSEKVDKLARMIRAESKVVMKELDDLETAVQQNTDAEQSAITLIQNLADQIKANAGDTAKINALADNLRNQAAALGAAVVANTPAA
jgi:hypothetical protein